MFRAVCDQFAVTRTFACWKTVFPVGGRLVSAAGALAGYGHLQLRSQPWRDPCSGHRSLGDGALWLARSISYNGSIQYILDYLVVLEVPHTAASSNADQQELRYIYERSAEQMGPQVRWAKLLTYRQTWAFVIAKFLTDPIWWFYLFWLPGYFDSRFHLGLSHMGLPLIIVYNMSAVGSIGGGWLPQLFGRFGLGNASSRMAAMLLCACLALPILFAGRTSSEWVAIALLSVAAGAHQGWSANLFTTASDMFPSNAVGSIVGIGGMAGSVGGVLLSLGAGRILQVTHNYTSLFLIAGSVYLLAVIVLRTLAPQLRRVSFQS